MVRQGHLLRAFVGEMSPTEFKEQLRRCFDINCNDRELGALMDRFDHDASGTIEGGEFLVEFLRLAKEGHCAENRDREATERRLGASMKRLEDISLARFNKVSRGVSWGRRPTHTSTTTTIESIAAVAVVGRRRWLKRDDVIASLPAARARVGECLRRRRRSTRPPACGRKTTIGECVAVLTAHGDRPSSPLTETDAARRTAARGGGDGGGDGGGGGGRSVCFG